MPDIERVPRVLFLGVTYVGHEKRFADLRRHSENDGRIEPTYRAVRGWRSDGAIERAGFLPRGAKRVTRTLIECAPFATLPRPDVIWTSARDAIFPYLWSQIGPLARPLIYDLDWTLDQQEEMAPAYFGRPSRSGFTLAADRLRGALVRKTVTIFTPWSRWTADALRSMGVHESRIRIIPPGVDLELWSPRERRSGEAGTPLRLLFVGGDFQRKGGPLLVDVFRRHFVGRCTLDLVTREAVPEAAGIRIHQAEPNSEKLRALYAAADIFVLPTRADTWGHATLEAMATGIPVIVSDVGAARDIVEEGRTGWLIGQRPEHLREAIERALAQRGALSAMGARAADIVRERFDGRANDARVVDLAVELAERSLSARRMPGAAR